MTYALSGASPSGGALEHRYDFLKKQLDKVANHYNAYAYGGNSYEWKLGEPGLAAIISGSRVYRDEGEIELEQEPTPTFVNSLLIVRLSANQPTGQRLVDLTALGSIRGIEVEGYKYPDDPEAFLEGRDLTDAEIGEMCLLYGSLCALSDRSISYDIAALYAGEFMQSLVAYERDQMPITELSLASSAVSALFN